MKTHTAHTPATASPAHTFFVMPASILKNDVDPVRILDGDGDTLATVNAPNQTKWRDPQAVATRIVACVNACEGLSDPIAQIKALREIETALRALINAPQSTTSEHNPLVIAARAALSAFGWEAGK